MSPATKDYYKALGVSEKATPEEIKKAYRRLAKRYHPDANQGDAAASERFKEVGEAYSVLSDSAKRKQYDQMRRLGAFGLGGNRRGPRPPVPGRRVPGRGFRSTIWAGSATSSVPYSIAEAGRPPGKGRPARARATTSSTSWTSNSRWR